MSAHVLLNLLNELRKRDKMRVLSQMRRHVIILFFYFLFTFFRDTACNHTASFRADKRCVRKT